MNATNDDLDVGHDLEITKTTRRAAGAGTWVCGTLSGHRFEVLVFPEHAENPEWATKRAGSFLFHCRLLRVYRSM